MPLFGMSKMKIKMPKKRVDISRSPYLNSGCPGGCKIPYPNVWTYGRGARIRQATRPWNQASCVRRAQSLAIVCLLKLLPSIRTYMASFSWPHLWDHALQYFAGREPSLATWLTLLRLQSIIYACSFYFFHLSWCRIMREVSLQGQMTSNMNDPD